KCLNTLISLDIDSQAMLAHKVRTTARPHLGRKPDPITNIARTTFHEDLYHVSRTTTSRSASLKSIRILGRTSQPGPDPGSIQTEIPDLTGQRLGIRQRERHAHQLFRTS